MATNPTTTLKMLAADVALANDLSKKQAECILTDAFSIAVIQLRAGNRVRIPGFGIFDIRKRPARIGRNPATGEQIQIKASKKLVFRAAKELKESI